jgi:hypothetical protein
MTNDKAEFSPLTYARIAGALYLVIIAGGLFAEMFVRQRFFVPHDPAATAANILAHEQLYRWGFVAQLVPLLCNMFLAMIMYSLFSVVNRRTALAVAFCSVAGSAVEASSLLAHFAPLTLLKRGAALGVDMQLLQAQAYMSFQLQAVGFSVALTFFGLLCITRGYLIYRSGFLPRFIGVFLAIEGVCYLVNSFGIFLAPQFAAKVFDYLLITGLAEVVLCLWLLIRGINVARWNEHASGSFHVMEQNHGMNAVPAEL